MTLQFSPFLPWIAIAAIAAAGLAAGLRDGLARAAEALDSGAALAKLDELVRATTAA